MESNLTIDWQMVLRYLMVLTTAILVGVLAFRGVTARKKQPVRSGNPHKR